MSSDRLHPCRRSKQLTRPAGAVGRGPRTSPRRRRSPTHTRCRSDRVPVATCAASTRRRSPFQQIRLRADALIYEDYVVVVIHHGPGRSSLSEHGWTLIERFVVAWILV